MNDDVQRELQRMFRDVEQAGMEADERAAQADPQAHKLSKTMERGKSLSTRYHGWVKGRGGVRTRYCWTVHRNVAGYYLAYREVERPAPRKPTKPGDLVSTVKRDQWTASRTKKRLEERCLVRFKAHKARLAPRGSKA